MMMRPRIALAATLLLLASPAWADSDANVAGNTSRAAAGAAAPPAKSSSFEALSAGDRKIARALFLAQHPTASGPAPLSLNQIADLKASDSWAKVFKQMQARGLVQAKSLGQVVEGYEHQRRSDSGSSTAPSTKVLVVNGQGFIVASTRNRGAGALHGGDEVAERGGSALATASEASANGQ
jgi:hypothetical protein